MKINLFSLPIFIGNIDSSKIDLENENFEKTWFSAKSSHEFNNKLTEDSRIYLLNTIGALISSEILIPFGMELLHIWQNNYEENDFQEKHMHPNSHFSFVIYKEITESKTIFFNPAENLIYSFYDKDFIKKTSFFKTDFQPKCRQDQIVVFPSFMEHMVQKNNKSVTISGNINVKIIKK